ncbi:unnamed protein product [Pleuronectes platessa]|uniref:Uncharacterized protein n=1 Tax=Pleuronectes platessa TaxID=8262 RepID=A0A9N7VGK7_PLEPL|nr:unnamed protein product [Pleuronectes platessa]
MADQLFLFHGHTFAPPPLTALLPVVLKLPLATGQRPTQLPVPPPEPLLLLLLVTEDKFTLSDKWIPGP